VGVAIYPNDGLDIDTLLERADSHMYRIKFDGKMANEQLFVRGSLVQDGQSD
jgi:GGDEF domain-containing protein